jgi:hypothetical protein
MKCELCNREIEKTFLNKIVGTLIKDKEGKKHTVCNVCQKEAESIDDLKKHFA